MTSTTSTLRDLLRPEGTCSPAILGHVLVQDGATSYILTADEAEAMGETWERLRDAADAIEDRQDRIEALTMAYGEACNQHPALHESQVSPEVAAALREWAGIDADDRLTWGW